MELPARQPLEIARGPRSLRVVWADGHRSEYGHAYLRSRCPCPECRAPWERVLALADSAAAPVRPVRIDLVGRYALRLDWSDGHGGGLYTYRRLRELCPCSACEAAREGRRR